MSTLLIIDPQNDFVSQGGSLVVPGAEADMKRLTTFISRNRDSLSNIHVTLDSHHPIDIAHPSWWKRVHDGANPTPFTVLGLSSDKERIVAIVNGQPTDEAYTTTNPAHFKAYGPYGQGSLGYIKTLTEQGHVHVIWPEHCLIGSWGQQVVPELHESLSQWERDNHKIVSYLNKGMNPFTEMFSAIKSEVSDPNDPDTGVNIRLMNALEYSNQVYIAGEALSHCVASTVRDIAKYLRDPKAISRFVLLTDACSSVPGFEAQGEAFLAEMRDLGMQMSTTTQALS